MLEVAGLTVRYGSLAALDGVGLSIEDREIVSVLGPSGSGKSTLLRSVAGLEPDASGAVRWDGVDLRNVPSHRRGFGLMFQDHALFPHRDVLGNVAFGLRMQHQPRTAIETRARETLALVGLAGFEHRRVAELSGGEQQRVALARALAPTPRLLMLYEPLGALDRALRDELVAELRALFIRLELTIVFVTHDHDEAFGLADRVVVMHRGRVAQHGTPAEVWDRPTDAFVARFLGWNVTEALGNGRVAVRPEALSLSPADGAAVVGETVGVAGVVAGRTFRGDHYLVDVDADGDVLRVAVSVRDQIPELGTAVRVRADAGDVRNL